MLAAWNDLVGRGGVGDVAVYAQPQWAVGTGVHLEDVSDGRVCDEANDVSLGICVNFVDKDDHEVDIPRLVLGVTNGDGFDATTAGPLGRGHVELGVARALDLLDRLLSVVLGENFLRKETCVDRDH